VKSYVFIAAVLLGGCASANPSGTTRPPASSASEWQRVVAPFTVLDENGTRYAHPFLGGFDVPRPHFVDIDADGDYDLFIQERSNELMFFENTGTAAMSAFVWRTDKFQDLDIGEWSRFLDLDRDGDLDLLAEEPFSYIRVFRNDGTREAPRFVLAADSLRNEAGQAIFSDRQNIPNITDIDCDGLYDLFLGRVEGTITRYEEEQQKGSDGLPRFRFVTDRFENIEIVAQIGSLHGANTMYFADIDEDGDQDLFWGDFFEDGVLFIENVGSCQSPNLRGEPLPLRADGEKLRTSGYNVPVIVDIDNDNAADLFVGVLGGAYNPNRTAADNFYLLERDAGGALSIVTRRFLGQIDVGSESVPAFTDIDGDGDLDLFVGNKLDPQKLSAARLFFFRNRGNARQPEFALEDTLDLAEGFHYAPAFGDLDGDDDPDLLLGTWNDGVQFYLNAGSRTQHNFVQDTTRTIRLTRGSNATPALVDIDDDGDLDLFVGEASGELNFFRNAGTPQDARFELVSDTFGSIDAGRRSHPAFLDIDGDGDYDLLLGSEAGGAILYRNDGTREEPRFVRVDGFELQLPHMGSPVFVDLDGDGRMEVVAGGLSGGLVYFR